LETEGEHCPAQAVLLEQNDGEIEELDRFGISLALLDDVSNHIHKQTEQQDCRLTESSFAAFH
jgi:hypothetical protein